MVATRANAPSWALVEDSMAWLRDDLRVALRRCRHQPAFTLVVIVTLALGLGANTAVFTLVDALLLRSLRSSALRSSTGWATPTTAA